LSPAFLDWVIVTTSSRASLKAVDINGARFEQTVDLSNAKLSKALVLTQCQFDEDLILSQLSTDNLISVASSHVTGTTDMRSVRAASRIVMDNFSSDSNVKLTDAEIGGDLSLANVNIHGALGMGAIRVKKSIVLTGGRFSSLDLTDAQINDELAFHGARVSGNVQLSGVEIGRDAFFDSGTAFSKNVVLNSAKIAGQLVFQDVSIGGMLSLEGVSVGGSLLMRNARLAAQTTMPYVSVAGNLEISSGGSYGSIDLTGARVSQGLRLGSDRHEAPAWRNGAVLILRNAVARDIQDRRRCSGLGQHVLCTDGWPSIIDLSGFRYENPSTLDVQNCTPEDCSDMSRRSSEWWLGWLARQRHFDPQSYSQLSVMLHKISMDDEAIDVLYAKKYIERGSANPVDKLFLVLYALFVGYGLHIWYVLWWVVGFILLGALVLRLSGEGVKNGLPVGLAFSSDMLLPVIQLREAHYQIDLRGWSRYYFYFHKVMGYVLGSFLLAGLAALVTDPFR